MKKSHLDLDNLFRKNISDYELTERQGNWELLNHLLNEKEKKKKNKWVIIFFFSLFLIIFSCVLIFLPLEENKYNTNVNGETAKTEIHSSSTNNLSGNENIYLKKNNKPQKNESEKIKKNNSEQITHEKRFPLHEEKNSKQNLTVTNKNSVKSHHSNKAPSVNTNHKIDFEHQLNLTVPDSNKSVFLKKEILSFPEFPIMENSDSQLISLINHQTTNENLIEHDSLNNKTNVDSLNVTGINNLLNDTVTSNENHLVNKRFLKLNFCFGINLYNTGGGTHANEEHISPIVGLEFYHSLSRNFNVGFSSLYSFQSGYHLSDTASVENYFLDKNISLQTIQIHQLQKLYFPLTLYYTVAPKHIISTGIQWSYLLNTRGDFSETVKISGVTSESKTNNVTGYMDGIKSNNIAVSLGYKFSLSKKFDWQTRITRELSDSYNKEHFYGINSKPLSSFQTYLIVKF